MLDKIRNLNISRILLGIFCLLVCVVSFFTLVNYSGRAIVYIIFTIVLNTLFVCGFTKNKIFLDTFIGIFLWLGFWLKFSVRVGFMGGRFYECVGSFSGTGAACDQVLLITSCGVSALLIATFIRRKFLFSYTSAIRQTRLEGIFAYYRDHRKLTLALFISLVVVVALTNVIFGVYQRGMVPRTILPFGLGGIYTWLLLFGLTSVSAVILDCEFRMKKDPYLASFIGFLECFFSNGAMLSRGMILNGGSLTIGLLDNARKRSINLGLRYQLIILVVFGALFVSSVLAVNYIRSYSIVSSIENAAVRHSKALKSKALDSRASKSRALDSPELNVKAAESAELNSMALKTSVRTTQPLILDRWVGIEGVMAVSSYPRLGWDLWKTAWQERYSHSGTSMYDLTFIKSPYLEFDASEYHFISLPGIVAFFYYPGSYVFLFFSMLLLGLLGAGIEIATFRLSGGNIILCSLIAQVVAYRYASFGYVPYQSYLLFGSIFLNVLIIFFLDRALLIANRRHHILQIKS
ncbi:MAG: hypothetical protein ABFD82_05360 [Syntrophaceae bacterium]